MFFLIYFHVHLFSEGLYDLHVFIFIQIAEKYLIVHYKTFPMNFRHGRQCGAFVFIFLYFITSQVLLDVAISAQQDSLLIFVKLPNFLCLQQELCGKPPK